MKINAYIKNLKVKFLTFFKKLRYMYLKNKSISEIEALFKRVLTTLKNRPIV